MKRTLSVLPMLGTLALALSACGGGLEPQTPEENGASTTAGQESGETLPDQGTDSTKEDANPSITTSASKPDSTTSSPGPGQSSSDPGTNPSQPDSSTTTSSGEESSSSDTGPIEVPAPYAGQKNPLDAKDTGVILAGGLRYKKNCGCHLTESQKHDPDAPDLGRGESSKRADDWMLWRISEGVAPKMGPFKDTFDETERWQIISYLRALTSKNESGG